jgi:hypothetical protein
MADNQEIPENVQNMLYDFHEAITDVEDILEPFFAKPLEQVEIKVSEYISKTYFVSSYKI